MGAGRRREMTAPARPAVSAPGFGGRRTASARCPAAAREAGGSKGGVAPPWPDRNVQRGVGWLTHLRGGSQPRAPAVLPAPAHQTGRACVARRRAPGIPGAAPTRSPARAPSNRLSAIRSRTHSSTSASCSPALRAARAAGDPSAPVALCRARPRSPPYPYPSDIGNRRSWAILRTVGSPRCPRKTRKQPLGPVAGSVQVFGARSPTLRIGCSVGHELTAALEQVRTHSGGFDRDSHDMGQSRLDNLSGVVRFSAVQSGNDERNPCGTSLIPCLPTRRPIGSPPISLPRLPTNTIGLPPPPSFRAASRISTARPHSGTRCGRAPFLRLAGTVQTRSARSISFTHSNRPLCSARTTRRESSHRAARNKAATSGSSRQPTSHQLPRQLPQ